MGEVRGETEVIRNREQPTVARPQSAAALQPGCRQEMRIDIADSPIEQMIMADHVQDVFDVRDRCSRHFVERGKDIEARPNSPQSDLADHKRMRKHLFPPD